MTGRSGLILVVFGAMIWLLRRLPVHNVYQEISPELLQIVALAFLFGAAACTVAAITRAVFR